MPCFCTDEAFDKYNNRVEEFFEIKEGKNKDLGKLIKNIDDIIDALNFEISRVAAEISANNKCGGIKEHLDYLDKLRHARAIIKGSVQDCLGAKYFPDLDSFFELKKELGFFE